MKEIISNFIAWIEVQFEAWIERRRERRECPTCRVLEQQLFHANNEKEKLLNQIIELTRPTREVVEDTKEYEPINRRTIPWPMRKAELERNDRETAARLEQIRKANEDLEKELDIKQDA